MTSHSASQGKEGKIQKDDFVKSGTELRLFKASWPVAFRAEFQHFKYTLWLLNIAMENGPFVDGLPIKNGDFPWLC